MVPWTLVFQAFFFQGCDVKLRGCRIFCGKQPFFFLESAQFLLGVGDRPQHFCWWMLFLNFKSMVSSKIF